MNVGPSGRVAIRRSRRWRPVIRRWRLVWWWRWRCIFGGSGVRSPNEAIAWCEQESFYPTRDWSQLCLEMVRTAWGIPTPKFRDAYAAWQGSSQQFSTPPPGAPIYWDHILIGGTPPRELGHVAVADFEPGWCWSIDILRSHPGRVDRVPIDLIRTKWGGHYLGWTSDLEGIELDMT